MSLILANVRSLVNNYVFRRVDGDPSPIAFWYLPEPARVVDAASFSAYLESATPSPVYLLDYRRKLEYANVGPLGLIVLNYGGAIGRQLNPEAAFQMALGLHDEYKRTADTMWLQRFLHYAHTLRGLQDGRGRWPYEFDWVHARSPWFSALSQGRGMSVMLRAALLTGDERFRNSALGAVEFFEAPTTDGGCLARHPVNGAPYYEEYPSQQPAAVMNGFMASLLGLYETGHWLRSAKAKNLFAQGIDSLISFLPSYTHAGWSLYDLDPVSPVANVNSPRYHVLTTDYLRVLAAISGRPELAAFRDAYIAMDTRIARGRAFARKVYKKIIYR